MNLLDERWIPVRRHSGKQDWIAPHQVTEADDPPVALAAARPDFNGALIQFLIGLTQTAWTKAGEDWSVAEMLAEPPTPEQLRERFAPLREAFELDGEGPCFMQDLTLCAADKPAENEIAALLIESPGDQALLRNTDHFVKRDGVQALCPACAATALFALQTNAPSGGAGHRTSLRGGGPLTTLVLPEASAVDNVVAPLWQQVACNVLTQDAFERYGNAERAEPFQTFPWLKAQTATQKDGGETQPDAVHPLQRYWAMPRRIRLDTARRSSGRCDVCARESAERMSHYLTKNYGLNYKGPWRHPLSPYYRAKPADPYLAMHPQPGGFAYRYWLGWVMGSQQAGKQVERAQVVSEFLRHSMGAVPMRLWAFGYDLDNMKARCWYESTFPLFALPASIDAQESLSGLLEQLLAAATTACEQLRYAIRTAWERDGDLSFADASFWARTEQGFFTAVRNAIALAAEHERDLLLHSEPLRRAWAVSLAAEARRLFNEIAASGDVVANNPQRLGQAWTQLCRNVGRGGDDLGRPLLQALGLATNDDPSKKPRRGKSKATTTPAAQGAAP